MKNIFILLLITISLSAGAQNSFLPPDPGPSPDLLRNTTESLLAGSVNPNVTGITSLKEENEQNNNTEREGSLHHEALVANVSSVNTTEAFRKLHR